MSDVHPFVWMIDQAPTLRASHMRAHCQGNLGGLETFHLSDEPRLSVVAFMWCVGIGLNLHRECPES